MSLTKEAMEHIENNAVAGKRVEEFFEPIILPDGYRVEDMEQYRENRNRFRGKFQTNSISEFGKYASEQPLGACFINSDEMRARMIFDLGTIDAPKHCKHTAELALRMTHQYSAMHNIDGARLDQKGLAEFIEDYRLYIDCYDGSKEAIEIKNAIAAIRRVTIEAKAESDYQVKQFSASKSAMEQIDASSGGGPMVGFICFRCVPYYGLNEYDFWLRVSLLASHDKPQFILRTTSLEAVLEEAVEEFKQRVTDAAAGKSIYIGTFTS